MTAQHTLDIGGTGRSRTILWLHGYTGSPGAFEPLLERLSTNLDAHIIAPLLPGHGTIETDLIGYQFADFLEAVRPYAHSLAAEEKPFTIVGYSFGSYLAAALAHEIQPQALVMTIAPFALRFPCNIPYLEKVFALRKFWDKYLTPLDVHERAGTFYYPNMPGTAHAFIKEGNERMRTQLAHITCPILTIHNVGDPLAASRSGADIIAASPHNPASEAQVLPGGRHALFFRPQHEREEKILAEFILKNT